MLSLGWVYFATFHLVIFECLSYDFRFISRQDLETTSRQFVKEGVTAFSPILIDVSRNQLFVGAKDSLYKLCLAELNVLEYVTIGASESKIKQCIDKGQPEEFCHNFIKVILKLDSSILICGTYAFSPMCTLKDIENISTTVTEWTEGVAKCPYSPMANITAFISTNGDYYYGGPTDFSGSDFLLSKTSNNLITRTKQYNSLWLNEPQFVGSFETSTFIYFVFREAAVEYINCGKVVYPRIARVCKNSNTNEEDMLKDDWSTFLKARLNCSISGEYPFYFNEVQSISFSAEEGIIYVAFTTPNTALMGSAICAYNVSAIDVAFNGPFKYQDHIDSVWNKHTVPNHDYFECKLTSTNPMLQQYKLMDLAVQSTTLSPLDFTDKEVYTHIAHDIVSTKSNNKIHVVYIATLNGLIKKLTIFPKDHSSCTVEIWESSASYGYPIRGIQFVKQTNSVYITTDYEVMKIPAEHCQRFVSKENCINAMDPYCGWNEKDEACTSTPNTLLAMNYWEQNISGCPRTDLPIDGGWSTWSEWKPCAYETYSKFNTDTCLCQKRSCTNPVPVNGGKFCMGMAIAVVNCTIHGGWSDWSAWSPCSASCGTAVKYRNRTCSNPTPAHNGRTCVGLSWATADCSELLPCPIRAVDGRWSSWEPWSNCSSSSCETGFKMRRRYCNNPQPRNGGQNCMGTNVEYRECTSSKCQEYRKHLSTNWTEEYNGFGKKLRRRFTFVCKVAVTQASLIKTSLKEEIINCLDDEQCFPIDTSHKSKLTTWSPWSPCSVSCGGGIQTRNRECKDLKCYGMTTQTRECNKDKCPGIWECWSEWSPCSSTCGWGTQNRTRVCLGGDCIGSNEEMKPCENKPCESLLGWGDWSPWSICDNGEQYRKRQCRSLNPTKQLCKGKAIETRLCLYNTEDIAKLEVEIYSNSKTTGIAAGCSFLAFIFGIIVGLFCYHIYMKKTKMKIPSSPHYMKTKQNPYITVPFHDRHSKSTFKTSETNLGSLHNSTLKSIKCEGTLKRNSYAVTAGQTKFLDDDTFFE